MATEKATKLYSGRFLSRARALVVRHWLTLLFVEVLALVYAVEWYVADAYGVGTYGYLFVASVEPAPAWVLAPYAHTIGDATHLLSSAGVILLFGPLVERALPRRRYAAFLLAAAYLSIGAQVVTYLVGDARGTLGASGVALAMVAFVSTDAARRFATARERVDPVELAFAAGGVILVVRRIERDLGLLGPPVVASAPAGHLAGVTFGTLYAVWIALRSGAGPG